MSPAHVAATLWVQFFFFFFLLRLSNKSTSKVAVKITKNWHKTPNMNRYSQRQRKIHSLHQSRSLGNLNKYIPHCLIWSTNGKNLGDTTFGWDSAGFAARPFAA